jgi:hypothetical protein
LATTLFERAHVLERSDITHGAVEYGKALRLLGRTIQDSTVCYGPENIVAALLLNLYEIVALTNRHGWIQHAGGIEKLIEMRAVHRHRRKPERHYFIMSQAPIITQALALRKHTFLGQEEWKSMPWIDDPASKSSRHFIQDTFANISGLLKDGNYLTAQKASKLTDTTTARRNMARD